MIKKIFNKLFSNIDSISFKEAMNLVELPVVTFFQEDKKIHFLLDSGTNNSIIDSNFIKNIQYTLTDVGTNLYGLDGVDHTAQICIIKTTYKDKEYEYPYVIQDMSTVFNKIKQETGVTINGILGTKFFNKYKYVLDFDELIAYSKE